MIHTNRCLHCGKTKDEHYWSILHCTNDKTNADVFYDTGLAALDAHKEELWEAAIEFIESKVGVNMGSSFERLQSILNQIEKEK